MFRHDRDEIGETAIESGVMRNIMIFAAIMIGLGTFMAQLADKMTPTPASATPSVHVAVTPDPAEQAGLRSLSIPRDGRGHFATEGRIDGQRIAFMVDTGASVIALNESSAARFGLRPSRSDYRATVTTANGTVKAAPTRLTVIDVGAPVRVPLNVSTGGLVPPGFSVVPSTMPISRCSRSSVPPCSIWSSR